MQKKLSIILSVLIIFGVILSACTSTPPAPTTSDAPSAPEAPAAPASEQPASEPVSEAPAAAQDVTLKVYLLDYTPDTIAWLNSEINPAFEAAHPGVKVEITEGSWSGWDTTFSGFFAAGEGPDIINLGSEMNTLYGESLADMEAYLGESAWPDIKNFGPALENAKFEGKIRGLPIFTAPRYVFCRTDLMEASG